jgi:hypothetical protein
MLAEYPDILLQVLAELRGAFLDGADTREQAIELLSAQITDPTSVQFAYQEVIDMSDGAKSAIETLLRENGEMAEAQFSREFGSIRQMGPAKLERETPWLYPESVAELLYYYGLLGRGFKGAGCPTRKTRQWPAPCRFKRCRHHLLLACCPTRIVCWKIWAPCSVFSIRTACG